MQTRKQTANDIIVAQSTAIGTGAIALVRLSGSGVIELVEPSAQLLSGKKLSEYASHTLSVGYYCGLDGQPIDQVLFIIMRGPRNFTGEDIVEISCHGNQLIVQKIIADLIARGARPANRGEFARRAVENERITIAQAEGINELICAQTETALKYSLAQVQGSLSSWITNIEKDLLQAIALCEASFEFVDDELDVKDQIEAAITHVAQQIDSALAQFDIQRHLREGFRIALIGTVNAGKSSLFNRIIGAERAIVTAHPGTTRDTIEATITRNGSIWTLIDTAGIRKTEDVIEQEGIRRSFQEAEKADVVLLLINASEPLSPELAQTYQELQKQHASKIIVVYNKSDLARSADADLLISTKTGENVDKLTAQIEAKIAVLAAQANLPFMLNQRHHELLTETKRRIAQITELLNAPVVHCELVSREAQETLELLANISGKSVTTTALDLLFQTFCVGK